MDEVNNLTTDGQEIESDTDTSGEEARRIDDFDDLRDRLERIESVLGNVASMVEAMRTTAAAIDIDNGGEVADGDGDGGVDVVTDDDIDIIPDYDDMDLDL